MHIALSDLKLNVGKHVDLAETEDIIITKYGKPAAKLVRLIRTLVFKENSGEYNIHRTAIRVPARRC